MIEKWESDFLVREGRRPGAADRASSRFFVATYHKRLELASLEGDGEASGAGGEGRGVSGRRHKHKHKSRGGGGAAALPVAQGDAASAGWREGRANASIGVGFAADTKANGGGVEAHFASPGFVAYSSLIEAKAGAPGAVAERDTESPDLDLNETQLAKAVRAFRKHDSDGDGTLQYAEFAAAVRDMVEGDGRPVEQLHLRAAFHRLDSDHSKSIDFHEYLQLCHPDHGSGAARTDALHSLLYDLEEDGLSKDDVERAANAFRRHDADRRGALSPRSFGLVVGKLALADGHKYTDDELAGLMRRADLDADGEVDFYELLKLLSRQKRVLKAKSLVDERRKERQVAADREVEAKQRADLEAAEAKVAATRDEASRAADAQQKASRLAHLEEEIAAQRNRGANEKRAALQASGADVAFITLLNEELERDGAMRAHAHVPAEVGRCAVRLYNKFETRRDGRLRCEDFVQAMKAYGVALGNQSAYKKSILERAFTMADSTNAGSLSIGDFIRYVGQGGVLHVNPVALATVAGGGEEDEGDGDGLLGDGDMPWAAVMGGGGGSASEEALPASDVYALNLRSDLEASGILDDLPHVNEMHVESCIEFYRAFDVDGDGNLTPREFVTGLKAYGRATGNPEAYQRRNLLDAFDAADVSEDARLELSEFVRYIAKNGKVNMEMKAMRRAAAEWSALRSFEAQQQGGASGGIFTGKEAKPAPGPPMTVHEWQRQQVLIAQEKERQARLDYVAKKKGGGGGGGAAALAAAGAGFGRGLYEMSAGAASMAMAGAGRAAEGLDHATKKRASVSAAGGGWDGGGRGTPRGQPGRDERPPSHRGNMKDRAWAFADRAFEALRVGTGAAMDAPSVKAAWANERDDRPARPAREAPARPANNQSSMGQYPMNRTPNKPAPYNAARFVGNAVDVRKIERANVRAEARGAKVTRRDKFTTVGLGLLGGWGN